MDESLQQLITEQRNERTLDLSELSIKDIIAIMNDEDGKVAGAVRQALPEIEQVIAEVVKALEQGGRLIYIGAGTSGRIGMLDASECPPTFGVDYNTVVALIAGGESAFATAVERAEDDEQQGADDLQKKNVTNKDVIVGLAASGRTPYVIGALKYAKQVGAVTASVTCNRNSLLSKYADLAVEVEVGPEVLTGSTRLKAATAQKMILNMITTTAMIKIGKVYQNLMIDLQVSNRKLQERARHILMQATGVTAEEAERKLVEADYHVKTAIVMIKAGLNKQEALRYLAETNGFVTKAIERALSALDK